MSLENPARAHRRATPRVPLKARIHMDFEAQRCLLSEHAVSFSAGGFFVRTQDKKRAGDTFQFETRLTPRGPLIGGRAEVAWVRNQDEGVTRPAGFGARFLEIAPEHGALLQELAEAYLAEGIEAVRRMLDEVARRNPEPPAEPVRLGASGHQTTTEVLGPVVPDELAGDAEPAEGASVDPEADTADLPPTGPLPAVAPAAGENVEAAPLAAPEPSVPEGESAATVPVATAEDDDPTEPLPPSVRAAATGAALGEGEAAPAEGGHERAPGPVAAATPAPARRTATTFLAVAMVVAGGLAAYLVAQRSDEKETSRDAVSGPAVTLDRLDSGRRAAPAPSPPGETLEAFGSVEDIIWRPSGEALEVEIRTNGFLPPGSWRHFRLEGPSPRVVVRVFGVEQAYAEEPAAVASPLLRRIRTGYHRGDEGPEQRVVLDLGGPEVDVASVETDGTAILIRLEPHGDAPQEGDPIVGAEGPEAAASSSDPAETSDQPDVGASADTEAPSP